MRRLTKKQTIGAATALAAASAGAAVGLASTQAYSTIAQHQACIGLGTVSMEVSAIIDNGYNAWQANNGSRPNGSCSSGVPNPSVNWSLTGNLWLFSSTSGSALCKTQSDSEYSAGTILGGGIPTSSCGANKYYLTEADGSANIGGPGGSVSPNSGKLWIS